MVCGSYLKFVSRGFPVLEASHSRGFFPWALEYAICLWRVSSCSGCGTANDGAASRPRRLSRRGNKWWRLHNGAPRSGIEAEPGACILESNSKTITHEPLQSTRKKKCGTRCVPCGPAPFLLFEMCLRDPTMRMGHFATLQARPKRRAS